MINIKSRFALFIAIIGIGSFSIHAQTLLLPADAVARALRSNYAVLIAKDDSASSDAATTRGNAGMLPRIDLIGNGSLQGTTINQRFSNGLEVNTSGVRGNGLNGAAALGWTLFDGGRMFIAWDRLKEENAMSHLQLKATLEDVSSQVLIIYFDLMRKQKTIEAGNVALDFAKEQLLIIQRKMELGAASNQELLQAKVDLNAAKSALIRQQLALDNQFVALNRLMNVALETTYLFPDSIPTVYSPSLDDLQAKAQSQSRAIQLAVADQRLQSFRLREEKAQRSPILNLSAAYNYNRTSSTAGFALFNQSSGPSAGLGLTWNLFQGGQLKSRIQQAEIGVHQTELLVLDQRAEISSAILIAFKSWKQASVLSELEKENMGFAQENLRLATERLRLGKAGILDVKEASRSYEQAVAAWSSAVFEQKAAEVNLLQLSGDLVK